MDKHEHRWKFALLAVFVLLITAQIGFFLVKLRGCATGSIASPSCDRLLEGYQDATNSYLQTILALMVGSGAIAAGTAAVVSKTPPHREPPPDAPLDRPLVRRHPDEDL